MTGGTANAGNDTASTNGNDDTAGTINGNDDTAGDGNFANFQGPTK